MRKQMQFSLIWVVLKAKVWLTQFWRFAVFPFEWYKINLIFKTLVNLWVVFLCSYWSCYLSSLKISYGFFPLAIVSWYVYSIFAVYNIPLCNFPKWWCLVIQWFPCWPYMMNRCNAECPSLVWLEPPFCHPWKRGLPENSECIMQKNWILNHLKKKLVEVCIWHVIIKINVLLGFSVW